MAWQRLMVGACIINCTCEDEPTISGTVGINCKGQIVKPVGSVTLCFATAGLSFFAPLPAFLLLADRSDAYLSRW